MKASVLGLGHHAEQYKGFTIHLPPTKTCTRNIHQVTPRLETHKKALRLEFHRSTTKFESRCPCSDACHKPSDASFAPMGNTSYSRSMLLVKDVALSHQFPPLSCHTAEMGRLCGQLRGIVGPCFFQLFFQMSIIIAQSLHFVLVVRNMQSQFKKQTSTANVPTKKSTAERHTHNEKRFCFCSHRPSRHILNLRLVVTLTHRRDEIHESFITHRNTFTSIHSLINETLRTSVVNQIEDPGSRGCGSASRGTCSNVARESHCLRELAANPQEKTDFGQLLLQLGIQENPRDAQCTLPGTSTDQLGQCLTHSSASDVNFGFDKRCNEPAPDSHCSMSFAVPVFNQSTYFPTNSPGLPLFNKHHNKP